KQKKKIGYGLVSYEWFLAQVPSLVSALGLSSSSLPILVSGNIFLYQNGSENDCCVYGWHGTYSAGGGTGHYAYWDYLDHGLLGKGKGKNAVADMYSLSHEVDEWMDDPFINNTVPQWVQPGSGACFSNLLEGADAIEALPQPAYLLKGANKAKWHPTDVAGI